MCSYNNLLIYNSNILCTVDDIVAEHDRVGAVDVVADHLPPNALAANVPDLQRDLDLRRACVCA